MSVARWDLEVLERLWSEVQGDLFWRRYFSELGGGGTPRHGIHLAVLLEPYLNFILKGEKTVESRFSIRRCPPFGAVQPGDAVILKRQSGPILGLCRVSHVWSYTLNKKSWNTIRREFTSALCAQDPDFWKHRLAASFATLMAVDHVCPVPPIHCSKRDRRGWVVITKSGAQSKLWNL